MYSYIKNFLRLNVVGYYSENDTNIEVRELPSDFPSGDFEVGIPLVWYNATNYNIPSQDPNVEFVLAISRTGNILRVVRGQQGTLATKKDIINKQYVLELVISKYHFDEIRDAINRATELDHTHVNIDILNQIDTPFTNALKSIYDEGLTTPRHPLPHTQGSDTIDNNSMLGGATLTDVLNNINENGLDIKELQMNAQGGRTININEEIILDYIPLTDFILAKWYVHIIDQTNLTKQSMEVLAHFNTFNNEIDYSCYAIIGESQTDILVRKEVINGILHICLYAVGKADGQTIFTMRQNIKLT